MKKIWLLGLCLLALGCTSIRMKYESIVQVEGKSNEYTYVNSYPVGGAHSSLCYITGIFFGGSCWYYLVMPTVNQKAMVIEEAQNKLAAQLAGKPYEEDYVRVSKVNFSEGPEDMKLGLRERAYTP